MQDHLDAVAGRLTAALIRPGDPDYDRARGAWNLIYSHRPAAVIEARSIDDVVEAVGLARRLGTSLAVQATGHGFTVAADDAVLVTTAGLDLLEIDEKTSAARIGAGIKWDAVLEAAQPLGLAPLLGSSPDVGAIGYTLGGGFGWLGRRYGLAADRVRSFTVVLADGSVVTASTDSHPELFWALRGGGHGNLGVVVEMEIELVPVTRVYAGNLLYPIEAANEVFDRYRVWSGGLSDDFTTGFTIMNYPPIDDIPEPLRGRSFAVVRGCHCGDQAEAAASVDEWRRWREPVVDMFGPMPFADIAAVSQDPIDPVPAMSTGYWLGGLDTGLCEAMVQVAAAGQQPSPVIFAETRQAGGAIARPSADTAFTVRRAERMLQVVALTPSPEAIADTTARFERLRRQLGDRITAPYLNFMEGEERAESGREAFTDDAWGRLVALKREVDPTGIFSCGLRIDV